MNRTQLNQKLKQLHSNYVRNIQEIDRKSIERQEKKINQVINEIEDIPLKTPKTEEKRTIEPQTEREKELYSLWEQWDNYRTYFPNSKHIWINNFPEWFVTSMNDIENR